MIVRTRAVFAFGDVAISVAAVGGAVREHGVEEGSHDGNTSAGAANAGLEYGPEESVGNGVSDVGVAEG